MGDYGTADLLNPILVGFNIQNLLKYKKTNKKQAEPRIVQIMVHQVKVQLRNTEKNPEQILKKTQNRPKLLTITHKRRMLPRNPDPRGR